MYKLNRSIFFATSFAILLQGCGVKSLNEKKSLTIGEIKKIYSDNEKTELIGKMNNSRPFKGIYRRNGYIIHLYSPFYTMPETGRYGWQFTDSNNNWCVAWKAIGFIPNKTRCYKWYQVGDNIYQIDTVGSKNSFTLEKQ